MLRSRKWRAPPGQTLAASAQVAPSAFGGGSFLGNLATRAAGVAAGAFLFQGIENLMGHRGGAWGSGGGWGQSMPMNAPMNAPLETTTINNYTTINEAPRGEPAHRDAATETRYADNSYATETSYADNGDFSADDGAAFCDDGGRRLSGAAARAASAAACPSLNNPG
ncbi:MAG: DUF2076 domain-containing protein [Candidatus Protistobacter heckmanni]|nr:DUF2076 domain-containing protein [Candidatus Protistobacter heckmanni]